MKDIRPTDHLANERTFLAYIRTSLSVMAFGFVIARFGLYLRLLPASQHAVVPPGIGSDILGIAFAVFGCALGAFGTWRYMAAAKALTSGDYRPNTGSPLAIGIGTLVLGLAVVASLFRLL